jgi:regulatory protein
MNEQQVLTKLTAMCSGAEHCTWEMTEKMNRWEVDETTQARIMDYLIREKYVDDSRYCSAYAREKLRFNKWGRRKIEQGLYMKHIPKSIYKPILDSIDDSDYADILRPLLKAKQKTVNAKSSYERTMKLMKFAMSRGFTYDVIRMCIDTDADPEDNGADW